MAQIARFTTPAFTYKPSAVDVADIVKVFLVIKQGANTITKDINDATTTEDGFTWLLTQTETQTLAHGRAVAQVDYLSNGGIRYTTVPKIYDITESAINEVI